MKVASTQKVKKKPLIFNQVKQNMQKCSVVTPFSSIAQTDDTDNTQTNHPYSNKHTDNTQAKDEKNSPHHLFVYYLSVCCLRKKELPRKRVHFSTARLKQVFIFTFCAF